MFLILFRNILCPQQMFPSLRSPRNIISNNVSATMCPRLPVPLYQRYPSSSEGATRAMRGQPKQLSRNYQRQNGGKFGLSHFICFQIRNVLCTLSHLFVSLGCGLLCARFHYFAVYSVLESLISRSQRQCVQWLCKSALCSFVVHFFVVLNKTRALKQRQSVYSKFLSRNVRLSYYILFGIFLRVIDKQNGSKFSRDS